MIHILIGSGSTIVVLWLFRLAERRKLSVTGWQWLLVFMETLYVIFVLEVIVSFLEEGARKGALVMGTILGFGALIGAFGLARWIFIRPRDDRGGQ